MSRRAQLADGTVLEFPDDTPDDVMDRVVKEHVTGTSQPKPFMGPRLPTPQAHVFTEEEKQANREGRGTVAEAPGVLSTIFGQDTRDISKDSPLMHGSDAAANVIRGIPQVITALPGAAVQTGKAVLEATLGPQSRTYNPEMEKVVSGATAPFTTPARELAGTLAPGAVNRPTQEELAASQQGAGAMLGGVLLEKTGLPQKVPGLASKAREGFGGVANALSDKFKPSPTITLGRGVGTAGAPADFITRTIPVAGDELHAWQTETGIPVDNVPKARIAIQDRLNKTNEIVKQIVDPVRDTVIPGARAEHAAAQIAAIPDEIRLNDPAKYQRIVADIQEKIGQGPEYTIGDIDEQRQAYERRVTDWDKSIAADMSTDASMKALDKASANWSIKKFYDSLDKVNNTGMDVGELKNRVGALIETDGQLLKRVNRSIIQSGQSTPAKIVEGIGHAMRSGKYAENLGSGVTSMIDADIKSAMRRWETTPRAVTPPAPGSPINAPVRPPIGPYSPGYQPEGGSPGPQENIQDVLRRTVENNFRERVRQNTGTRTGPSGPPSNQPINPNTMRPVVPQQPPAGGLRLDITGVKVPQGTGPKGPPSAAEAFRERIQGAPEGAGIGQAKGLREKALGSFKAAGGSDLSVSELLSTVEKAKGKPKTVNASVFGKSTPISIEYDVATGKPSAFTYKNPVSGKEVRKVIPKD